MRLTWLLLLIVLGLSGCEVDEHAGAVNAMNYYYGQFRPVTRMPK
jgi:hypothetical protein